MTSGEILTALKNTPGLSNDNSGAEQLEELLEELLGSQIRGELTSANVSAFLRRYKNRIIDGKLLRAEKDGHRKQVLFNLENDCTH